MAVAVAVAVSVGPVMSATPVAAAADDETAGAFEAAVLVFAAVVADTCSCLQKKWTEREIVHGNGKIVMVQIQG